MIPSIILSCLWMKSVLEPFFNSENLLVFCVCSIISFTMHVKTFWIFILSNRMEDDRPDQTKIKGSIGHFICYCWFCLKCVTKWCTENSPRNLERQRYFVSFLFYSNITLNDRALTELPCLRNLSVINAFMPFCS